MAGKPDGEASGSLPVGKAADQLKESTASLPSLASLDPSKGDGFLAWVRSLNFNSMTKRFVENFVFRAMGRVMKFGYTVVHQDKELGSMDVQQTVAASVTKVACTATAARRLAYELVRPPATLVHYALNPLMPFSHRAAQDSAARYCAEGDPAVAAPGAPPAYLGRAQQTSLITSLLTQTGASQESAVNH